MLKTINDGITKIFTEGNGHGPITKQDMNNDQYNLSIRTAITSLVLKTVGLSDNPLVGIMFIPRTVSENDCSYEIRLNFDKDKVTLSNEIAPEGCTIDVENCTITRTISIPQSLYIVDGTTLMGLTDAGKKVTNLQINLPFITNIDIFAFKNSTVQQLDLTNTSVSNLGMAVFKPVNATLNTLVLGPKLHTVDITALKDCSHLTTLDCGNATSLDKHNFCNLFVHNDARMSINNIVLPSNWNDIDVQYSKLQKALTEVLSTDNLHLTLPDTCEIPDGYFSNVQNISTITGKNITNIGENAFFRSSLVSFECNPSTSTATYICTGAFYDCSKLVHMSLLSEESNITTIWQNAFRNCPLLTDVLFPHNIQFINEGAFKDSTLKAPENKHFSINNGCVVYNYAFDYTKLENFDGSLIDYAVVKSGNNASVQGNDILFGPKPN